LESVELVAAKYVISAESEATNGASISIKIGIRLKVKRKTKNLWIIFSKKYQIHCFKRDLSVSIPIILKESTKNTKVNMKKKLHRPSSNA
jgi:hypothetical protein